MRPLDEDDRSLLRAISVLLAFVFFLLLCGVNFIARITFWHAAEIHLVRAAHASSLPEIMSALHAADKGLAKHCTRPGYTSILFPTEDENVTLFCAKLAMHHGAADHAVAHCSPETQARVAANIRRFLIRSQMAEGDIELALPEGMSLYPWNRIFALFMFLTFLLLLTSLWRLLFSPEETPPASEGSCSAE